MKKSKDIRSGVITHCTKFYILRNAEYMTVNKHLSSTERYQVDNLDQL